MPPPPLPYGDAALVLGRVLSLVRECDSLDSIQSTFPDIEARVLTVLLLPPRRGDTPATLSARRSCDAALLRIIYHLGKERGSSASLSAWNSLTGGSSGGLARASKGSGVQETEALDALRVIYSWAGRDESSFEAHTSTATTRTAPFSPPQSQSSPSSSSSSSSSSLSEGKSTPSPSIATHVSRLSACLSCGAHLSKNSGVRLSSSPHLLNAFAFEAAVSLGGLATDAPFVFLPDAAPGLGKAWIDDTPQPQARHRVSLPVQVCAMVEATRELLGSDLHVETWERPLSMMGAAVGTVATSLSNGTVGMTTDPSLPSPLLSIPASRVTACDATAAGIAAGLCAACFEDPFAFVPGPIGRHPTLARAVSLLTRETMGPFEQVCQRLNCPRVMSAVLHMDRSLVRGLRTAEDSPWGHAIRPVPTVSLEMTWPDVMNLALVRGDHQPLPAGNKGPNRAIARQASLGLSAAIASADSDAASRSLSACVEFLTGASSGSPESVLISRLGLADIASLCDVDAAIASTISNIASIDASPAEDSIPRPAMESYHRFRHRAKGGSEGDQRE